MMKLVSLLFILCGTMYILIYILKRRRCSVKVEGEIIEIKSKIGGGSFTGKHLRKISLVYSPVYSFIYNNKRREYCSNCYNSIVEYELGDKQTLYINPNNENEICVKLDKKILIFQAIFSITYITIGIGGLILSTVV